RAGATMSWRCRMAAQDPISSLSNCQSRSTFVQWRQVLQCLPILLPSLCLGLEGGEDGVGKGANLVDVAKVERGRARPIPNRRDHLLPQPFRGGWGEGGRSEHGPCHERCAERLLVHTGVIITGAVTG